jgi:chorismate mutase
MAATKFRSGAPVEDLLRERQVLAEAGRPAVIRQRLDELTAQPRSTQVTHRLASLCRRLQEVRIPVAAVHHLDALHRRALDLATEWACSAD